MARLRIIVDDGNTYTPKPTEPKQPYRLAVHRILVNGWSFERLTKIALYAMQRLRSLYKTADGWKPDMTNVLWYPYYPHDNLEMQPWNKKFKSNIPEKEQLSFYLACDVRYEKYWDVGGIEYDDYDMAFDRLYEMLFIESVVPMLVMELTKDGVI